MEILELIIKISQCVTAIGIICGAIYAFVRWIIKQNGQDDEIEAADRRIDEVKAECNEKINGLKAETDARLRQIQAEQTVICYGVLAALKGLKEQGCNGPVTEAINRLEKHLNLQAHK